MRYCGYSQKLCDHLVISEAVTFAAGTLTVNIPEGSYGNMERYCIVVAQTIPDTATVTAPVVITIGAGTVTYPFVDRCGVQLTAADVQSRRKYATVVVTNTTGGVFRLLGRVSCNNNNLAAIDGTDA